MSATGAGKRIVLHPIGTFSNVPADRRRIKRKIFSDMFDWNLSGDTGDGRTSDPAAVRHLTRSFSDVTPYRRRVRDKILAEIFSRNSSGGGGGGKTSDPVGSLSDATLYCGEIFAYLLKME